jgi:hypothetical protein
MRHLFVLYLMMMELYSGSHLPQNGGGAGEMLVGLHFTLSGCLHFTHHKKARYLSAAGLWVGACHIDRHLIFVICFAVVASS